MLLKKLKRLRLLFNPICLLTLIGALLRFTNLNWDMGGRLHPDEALIVNGALSIRFFSQLFPGFHDYNGFSIYLLRLFSPGVIDPVQMTLIGRFLSATLATATIPLIYATGFLLGGTPVGIIAALLLTFTPLGIQLAHFYTTDTLLIFLLLCLVYAALKYWRKPTRIGILYIAVASGLALASKNTAIMFLPIAFGIVFFSNHKKKTVLLVLLSLLILLTFFIASPYSFLDFSNYLARSHYIALVVNGTYLYEWSAQFQHTTPLFWFTNLMVALGPLALIGPIGILSVLTRKKLWHPSNHSFPLILFSLWGIGFSFFLAYTYLKFIRYDAPLIPAYTLCTAVLLVSMYRKPMGKIFVGIIIAAQLLWGIMCYQIYLAPNTSLAATDWIATHVPPHATIIREAWNGIIHFDTKTLQAHTYNLVVINFYAGEWTDKQMIITDALKTSDYIVLESPKVKNTIHRIKDAFPKTDAFYQNLSSGKLGFTKVATFTSYPRLGPISINDESAEETWYVFDHPTVTIYKRK